MLLALLWFAIPGLTSKSVFSAGSLAENSPRELHGNKITGTYDRFSGLDAASVKLAALLAVVLAALRRDRAVLLLAGGVVLWVVVEMAFALHGWPAVPRYMYEAAGGVCVLAGVFAGRVILDAPAVLAALRARVGSPRLAWLSAPWLGGAVAAVVLAAFAIAAVPAAHQRYREEQTDLHSQRARTRAIGLLAQAVAHVGAARIRACGQPNIPIGYQSVLAWDLGTNTGILYFDPKHERAHPYPAVKIYPHSYGWQIFPVDSRPSQAASCRSLVYRTS